MASVVSLFSKILSFLFPIRKSFVFFSYPNFTDNAYALFTYIYSKSEYSSYKKIWIIDDEKNNFSLIKNQINRTYPDVIVHKRNSFLSILDYYCCEKFFFTHSLYSSLFLVQKNKRINLWHGMPLKKIGNLQDNAPKTTVVSDYIIASSPLFKKIMSDAFSHPIENVLITGMPRNDLFGENTDFFESENIHIADYKKIAMWLPTYKRSIGDDGSIVIDGKESNGISFLDYDDLCELNDFLIQERILILVKIHPMDILNQEELPSYSNIRIYKSDSFNYQLYPVLGKMDFLITDYSSVWVDYEILNKPILFVFNDIEEYSNNRGFTIDNLLKKLPGSVITNKHDLLTALKSIRTVKSDSEEWNTYKDNNSSKRIMSYLYKNK